jgi:tetratricopeptide (TPR) repeat protein
MISMAVSMTLIWAQARETKKANDDYHKFIVGSFSLMDQSTRGAIASAFQLLQGDHAARQEAFEIFGQALIFYQAANELPPNDLETRVTKARARSRLGYTHWMLSSAKGINQRYEPQELSAATADYRQSVDDFEKLLVESPGDAKIRRYFADAIGLFGFGCCLRFAHNDAGAEPFYRRAIQLRRDLLRGTGSAGVADAGVRGDLGSDLNILVNTVHLLAGMLDDRGRKAEAEDLRRQLEDDVVALAARFPGPNSQGLRKMWAGGLLQDQSTYTASSRRILIQNSQLAMVLDPENAEAHNNLAWMLVSVPEDPWYDPQQALILARKAVELNPTNWMLWNTLGVAEFRLGKWKAAEETFLKSIGVNGGQAIDWLFLAMTRWHQGKKGEGRDCFDRAVAWILRNNRSKDPELHRFQAEAAALLGLPCPNLDSQTDPGGRAAGRQAATAPQKSTQPVESNKSPKT